VSDSSVTNMTDC